MSNHACRIVLLLVSLYITNVSAAQTTISGSIVKGTERSTVRGVQIDLMTTYGTRAPGSFSVYSDVSGEFVVDDVNSGTWRLRFFIGTKDLGYSLLSPKIEVSGDPINLELKLAPDELNTSLYFGGVHMLGMISGVEVPEGRLRGVVLDVDTFEPITGAVVGLMRKPSTTSPEVDSTYSGQRTVTDEIGHFEIEATEPDVVLFSVEMPGYSELAVVHLSFSKSGLIKVYIRSLDSPLLSINLRSLPKDEIFDLEGNDFGTMIRSNYGSHSAQLKGRITIDGLPLIGARIELLNSDYESVYRFLVGESSIDGDYLIFAIEPGSYVARITKDGRSFEIPSISIGMGTTNMDFSF